MPNFNLHWLVAFEALDKAPLDVQRGARAYAELAGSYAGKVRAAVACATPKNASKIAKRISERRKAWEEEVRASPSRDDMTCFSAYLLGACGPDLWTVPSGALSVASHHFDLGHYNRTHRQFEVSVGRVAKQESLQARVEQAYFCGMATHVATDTVIHQLVNVNAGAYNLLDYLWSGERGSMAGAKKWNMHNKVEHYWDSYVRHRYLGDHGPVFGAGDAVDRAEPRGFLTIETLLAKARQHANAKVRDELVKQLSKAAVTYAVEKPLMFPWLFCDRALAKELRMFIYAVVVDKTSGAYPRDVMYEAAIKEASSAQMGVFTYDENDKLLFFSSDKNRSDGFTSWNYLNYFVCPDLAKVQGWGKDVFYELAALDAFLEPAKLTARSFQQSLEQAYASGSAGVGALGGFWNLDTGLGIEVRRIPSDTTREVVTRLSFVHVLECRPGTLTFVRKDPHIPGQKQPVDFPLPDGCAFPVYDQGRPLPALLGKVEEEDARLQKKEYLRRIRLEHPDAALSPGKETIDDKIFFGTLTLPPACAVPIPTKGLHPAELCVAVQTAGHRLTLEMEVALHDLGAAAGDVGMILYGDDVADVRAPWTGEAHGWIRDSAKVLDHSTEPREVAGGLRFFRTQLLVDLDKVSPKREVAKGKLNNAVPRDDHKGSYGRNFAISTSRRNVLHPADGDAGRNAFDGARAFAYHPGLSPTEHLFFTLFTLVKTADGVHDAFTGKPVAEADLKNIRKIDALGFVKIVLFYVVAGGGALVLDECLVDGLRVKVIDGEPTRASRAN